MRVLATHSIRQFPFTSPPPCVTVCPKVPNELYQCTWIALPSRSTFKYYNRSVYADVLFKPLPYFTKQIMNNTYQTAYLAAVYDFKAITQGKSGLVSELLARLKLYLLTYLLTHLLIYLLTYLLHGAESFLRS